jgi:ADP-ribose pyrophosphatase
MNIKQEIVHDNPWFKISKEEFTRHDGAECTFYVVQKNPAVFILPFESNIKSIPYMGGSIYLVKLYRHATRTWGWELPAGSIDSGETPIIAAKRELQEETGLSATYWEQLKTIHLTPGLSNNITYIFIAKHLTLTENNKQAEEGIVECKPFSIQHIKNMIKSGEIHDAPTIATLALVLWVA